MGVPMMDPPLLIPKLTKISGLVQHTDNEAVDLLGLPSSEKGRSEKMICIISEIKLHQYKRFCATTN